MLVSFKHAITDSLREMTITLRSSRLSIAADEEHYSRHYFVPLTPKILRADPCQPPTPVSDLDNYRNAANQHAQALRSIVNTLSSNSLLMGPFANAVNAYGTFLRNLPASFCIGPSNQEAYDALVSAINGATAVAQQGVGIFESNFDRYCNGAIPLLSEVIQRSQAINASSRDFIPVMNAVDAYQQFVNQFQVEVWNLSARIESLANNLGQTINVADQSLASAINQIETNVETEAQRFVKESNDAENAFRFWDTEDGADGYASFIAIARTVADLLIPEFNAFIQRVPATPRVRNAITLAQQAIDYIGTNLNSFPTFQELPTSSAAFPYQIYWVKDRRYGKPAIIAVLRAACIAHKNDTGNTLYVGDMQYKHGGKAKPHVSHREGNDADVDPVEIGNIPNHDAALALAAAKRFLAAGASLIFYADQSVVNDANAWAQQQGIGGRLQYEANHTNHFHLRAT